MSPADADPPAPEGLPGEPTPPTIEPAGLPAVRPGPAQLDADSWADPPPAGTALVTYEGRRRVDPPARRLWLVITLILLGLGAVVAIPIILVAGGGDRAASADSSGPATSADGGDHTLTAAEASLVPATGAAAGITQAPRTTTTGPRSTTTKAPVTPAFAPVTLEAEGPGVTLSGSAHVDGYPGASNGSIVRNLGRWDKDPGTLRLDNVSIPTDGAYVITIYFVHLDGEPTRTAQISVSGAGTVTQSFTGSATCCASQALPAMTLAAGTHTITIGNSSGHAPSVDKIVISRP